MSARKCLYGVAESYCGELVVASSSTLNPASVTLNPIAIGSQACQPKRFIASILVNIMSAYWALSFFLQ